MKILILISFFFFSSLNVFAQDWPDWRGENRDGVWNETGIVEKFDSDALKHKWSVEIGSGYSGPTVANGKVYVTDRIEEPKKIERVLCLDEQTGKRIWTYEYESDYIGVGYPAGP